MGMLMHAEPARCLPSKLHAHVRLRRRSRTCRPRRRLSVFPAGRQPDIK